MQRQGRLRGGAMAYPLFDHKRASDMVSWARLRPLADWHVNVTFDECDSADFSASAWGQLSTKVAQLVAGVLPSLRASGPRCRGTFSVAEIPVHAWAGQASQLSDGRPAALKRATQRHDSAPSSACTVHRGAVLHAGKLWNVTVSPPHAQHRQQRDRAAN
eukprot:scaffold79713_cov81-Phaeocystis_antarctica.AAC.1